MLTYSLSNHGDTYMVSCVFAPKKTSMAAKVYIYDLDGRILLWAAGFACGPLALGVSTLVAMGPDTGIATTVPAPPSVGLATAIDGDLSGCTEAGGPASSHQPFPTTHI